MLYQHRILRIESRIDPRIVFLYCTASAVVVLVIEFLTEVLVVFAEKFELSEIIYKYSVNLILFIEELNCLFFII
jgi:hypothetical protein